MLSPLAGAPGLHAADSGNVSQQLASGEWGNQGTYLAQLFGLFPMYIYGVFVALLSRKDNQSFARSISPPV